MKWLLCLVITTTSNEKVFLTANSKIKRKCVGGKICLDVGRDAKDLAIKVKDIRRLYNLIRKYPPCGHISFVWIPAHVGIQGNENVDRIAKAALNRALSSGKLCWPDLKPKVNIYIHTIWQENWDAEGPSKLYEVLRTWEKTSAKEVKEQGYADEFSSTMDSHPVTITAQQNGLQVEQQVPSFASELPLHEIQKAFFGM
ncbi:RNAse h family protein [Plakobranchus ocellatus]|uniref:RNAse h family protein n=1 Tax=Plakobranchus ocellatus TaxID=259542 RepID=A0AAV4DUN1_9GAST|nr:RNAse h family protein [Plakobranchus ocellatus]